MPSSSKYCCAKAAISASSRFKILSPLSKAVTSAPKRAYRFANSMPILPQPMIPNRLGNVGKACNSVLLYTNLDVDRPGIGRTTLVAPVLMMIISAVNVSTPSAVLTSTSLLDVNLPCPVYTVTLGLDVNMFKFFAFNLPTTVSRVALAAS